ncbi:hypothetical protein Q5P01_005873 [Channa striata]|uniref:Uncharacterized protein n=1 Tax=Channa striata TaxID=64152 RepID=A0AA88SYX8_CHASR|nr:hypothetical protein Q5P01_005873 [Channa striata]
MTANTCTTWNRRRNEDGGSGANPPTSHDAESALSFAFGASVLLLRLLRPWTVAVPRISPCALYPHRCALPSPWAGARSESKVTSSGEGLEEQADKAHDSSRLRHPGDTVSFAGSVLMGCAGPSV